MPSHHNFSVRYQFSRTRRPLYLKLQTNYRNVDPHVTLSYFYPTYPSHPSPSPPPPRPTYPAPPLLSFPFSASPGDSRGGHPRSTSQRKGAGSDVSVAVQAAGAAEARRISSRRSSRGAAELQPARCATVGARTRGDPERAADGAEGEAAAAMAAASGQGGSGCRCFRPATYQGEYPR
jgi:hypothetical protein